MKKNLNARKAQSLKLNRETLINLQEDGPRIVGGTNQELLVPSVKFCSESGCTTTGG